MPLITYEYRLLNEELHQRAPRYGAGGHRWADFVKQLRKKSNSKSILDYGSGKGSLKAVLAGYDVREYDPAVEGKKDLPSPADLVVCTDVLEHVEPECLKDVTNHIRGLAQKAILLVISCEVGEKRLADGRPAHINVQPPEYWEKYFGPLFERFDSNDNEYAAVWLSSSLKA